MAGLGNEMCDAAGIVEILSLKDCEIRFSAFICCAGDGGKLYLISLLLPFLRDREIVLDSRGWELWSEWNGDSFSEISFVEEFQVVGLSSGKNEGQSSKSEERKTWCFFQRVREPGG